MTKGKRWSAKVRPRAREQLKFRGPLLVELREARKLTRDEVADVVGGWTGMLKNSKTTVTHWEVGGRSPWGASLAGLCHLFDLQPMDWYQPKRAYPQHQRLKPRMVSKLKFSGKALTRIELATGVHDLELADEIAEYTGRLTISRQTVGNWRRGGSGPNGVCAAALCHLLDCHVSDFYGVLKAPKP